MTPIKAGKYEYRPSSLIQLRQKLKLKQKEMAKQLGIPPNTLSRWENGASTPDAESLAAIYSLAMERKVEPEFFHRRKATPRKSANQSHLVVLWDFQYVEVSWNQLDQIESWVKSELNKRFGSASHRLFKAFVWDQRGSTTEGLAQKGWRIFEDDEDLFDDIYDQAKSDCGHDPEDTTLVLIACDEEYAELIAELKQQGVRVYVITPPNTYDGALVKAVDKKQWIQLPDTYSAPFYMRSRRSIRYTTSNMAVVR